MNENMSTNDLRRMFRFYKWTSIYVAICLTIIVVLLIRGAVN